MYILLPDAWFPNRFSGNYSGASGNVGNFVYLFVNALHIWCCVPGLFFSANVVKKY